MAPDLNGGASRVIPVRLTDVPVAIRRQFGHKLMDDASDGFDIMSGMKLNQAIENPSERVYWIPVTKKSLPWVRRVFGKNWE